MTKHFNYKLIIKDSDYKIDFEAIKELTLESKIDILTDSSPVSDYEFYMNTQLKKIGRDALDYTGLENRLKDIFKTIDAEIFVTRRPDFDRIKKQLLKKEKKLTESKLSNFLKGYATISESCNYIKELLNEKNDI